MGRPTLPSTEEINRRAHLEERIIRRFDTLHAGYGIENHVLLLLVALGHHALDLHGAQFRQLTRRWPVDRRVVDGVALLGNLREHAEGDGPTFQPLRQLVEQESGVLLLLGGRVEVLLTCLGDDAVPEVGLLALGVDEFQSRHAEVRLLCEACRGGLGGLHEGEGFRVGAQELFHGRGRFAARRGCD